VRRAIRAHRVDFAAIAVLVVAAIAVSAYILEHQPSFVFGQTYYQVRAPFATAAAVTAGQGQAVTIAGVQVGQVGGVSLHNGQAIVTMNIYKQYAPIYRNATVLLRPRTPLKDMYLELDPGTRTAGRVPNGGALTAANTQPDVDVSEILSSLDADTRNYLVLLLSAGAQAFKDPNPTHPWGNQVIPSRAAVADLRGTLKRFEPLDRDTKRFATLLATRQANIRRAIHNLNLVTNAFGGVEGQLASLIRASDTNFSAIAVNDAQLQQTLTEFPPTLQQSISTLGKVRGFANASTTALQQLLPFARNLGPALKASRPLFRDTTPVIAHQLRPFSVAVQPLARTLAAGAPKLKTTIPSLSSSISVLNTLFNELAHDPGRTHPGQQSYLFWGSWLAHIADSLVSSQDANGAVLQGIFMNTCAGLSFYEKQLEPSSEPLGVILDLLNAPDVSQLPGATPSVIAGQVNCPSSP
jgi:phospholipid/cholesterol/gamma-HCH transport system substrate-binding protein